MIVETLYRDGHKEKLLCGPTAALAEVVALARAVYDRSEIKHVRIVPHGRQTRH